MISRGRRAFGKWRIDGHGRGGRCVFFLGRLLDEATITAANAGGASRRTRRTFTAVTWHMMASHDTDDLARWHYVRQAHCLLLKKNPSLYFSCLKSKKQI
jgi:hypothetical protein